MSETAEATPLPRRPKMLLVAEQQVPDPQPAPMPLAPPALATQPQPDLSRELMSRAAWRAAVIGSLNVAAQILAARLVLLLSVVGAFALGWRAVSGGQPMQLGAVGLYTITVVLPITWLCARR